MSNTMMAPPRLRVAVLGGGIGGLTFANALRRCFPSEVPLLDVTVYERGEENSTTTVAPSTTPGASTPYRGQGYSISLRNDMGFKVLKQIGFSDDDRSTISTVTKDFSFVTETGRVLLKFGRAPTDSPYHASRVDRPSLHRLLLRDLPEGAVQWKKKAIGVQKRTSNNINDQQQAHVITFEDGTTAEADLVVACDGHRSVIRREVMRGHDDREMLDVTLISSRVMEEESESDDAQQSAAAAAAATGKKKQTNSEKFYTDLMNDNGTLFVLGPNGAGDSMFLSPNSDRSVAWSYGFKRKQAEREQLLPFLASPACADEATVNAHLTDEDRAAGYRVMVNATKNWTVEPVRRLVAETKPEHVNVKRLVHRPVPKSLVFEAPTSSSEAAESSTAAATKGNKGRDDNEEDDEEFSIAGQTSKYNGKRVVLLGDAAHPMTPYMGLGANSAMVDAWELAEKLARSFKSNQPIDNAAARDEVLNRALCDYDGEAVERARRVVKDSLESCDSFHATEPWPLMARWMKLTALRLMMGVMTLASKDLSAKSNKKK